MTNEERKGYIGGSDIAAVMGLSRWSTPLKTWAIKTGKVIPKDISTLEHVEIGSELEEYVAQKFSKKTGFKVRRDSREFIHPELTYARGHIDRWIVGEDALLECKTTSAWMKKEWEGEEMPREYILQVVWYLGLVGKSTGYVACLIGGQKFAWKQIPFDAVLFLKMLGAAQDFWENYVQKDVPPLAMAEDSEVLDEMYGNEQESIVRFDGENEERLNALIEERQGGLEQKKLVEDDLDRINNQIKQFMGEAMTGETSRHIVTLKKQRVQPFINVDAMKDDGVYEKYRADNYTRVLRTKQRKGVVVA